MKREAGRAARNQLAGPRKYNHCYDVVEAVKLACQEAERRWKAQSGAARVVTTAEGARLAGLCAEMRTLCAKVRMQLTMLVPEAVAAIKLLLTVYTSDTRPTLPELCRDEVNRAKGRRAQTIMTFQQVLAEYYKYLVNRGMMEGGTQGRRQMSIGNRFAKRFGGRVISTITQDEIELWIADEFGMTIVLQTVEQYVSALRSVFEYARRKLKALPAAEIETAADRAEVDPDNHLPNGKSTVEAYNTAEIGKIEIAAESSLLYSDWAPVIVLQAKTGAHLMELIRSRKKQVKFTAKGGTFAMDKDVTKKHNPRVVPFSPATATQLEPPGSGDLEEWIVPGVQGSCVKEAEQCYTRVVKEYEKALNSILRDAGVKKKDNGFRKGFGTAMMSLIWNLEVLGYLMGSAVVNLAPHYLDMVTQLDNIHRGDAHAWFVTSRFGSGNFSKLKPTDWLPAHVFKNVEEARTAVMSAIELGKAIKAAASRA